MRKGLFVGLALSIATPLAAGQAAAQQVTWRMATIDTETGVYFTNIAKPFAEWVDRLTSGRTKIDPLPAGTVASLRRNGLTRGRGRPKRFARTVLSSRTTRLRNEAVSP